MSIFSPDGLKLWLFVSIPVLSAAINHSTMLTLNDIPKEITEPECHNAELGT